MNSTILPQTSLEITEIFYSIQGEGSYTGLACAFIRMSGCNLSCVWCDTKYSHSQGNNFSIPEILKAINLYNCNLVEITGGEPLLQKNIYPLFEMLNRDKKKILLETNGSISLNRVPDYVHIIMDIKTPSSMAYSDFFIENLPYLKYSDEMKIVISNRKDFDWALNLYSSFNFNELLEKPVILQPAYKILSEKSLAMWILESGKSFKLGLQLHKYIFGENVKGV